MARCCSLGTVLGVEGKGAACFYISYWVLAESYKCESMKG